MEFSLSADEYSPLVLAYMGDSVYEQYVRGRLVSCGNMPVGLLHRRATEFVSAPAQFEAARYILPFLTPNEDRVFRRGRNAHHATVPKNASVVHYRHATGFEALVGYLYIKGENDRLLHILDLVYERLFGKASGGEEYKV